VKAWLSLPVGELAAMTDPDIAARLSYAQASRHATLELAQRHAWEAEARLLRAALQGADPAWRLLFECDLLRLEKRADAVLLTDRAILVMEFKHGARSFEPADLRQAEDYALDLHDFHAGSRRHPVVPILVATAAPPARFDPPLIWHGVAPVLRSNGAQLGALIAEIQAGIGTPAVPLVPAAWESAAYRPVPTVLEAATMLYRRHSVAEIAAARADAPNLTRTTEAIARAIAQRRRKRIHLAVFVTGIPARPRRCAPERGVRRLAQPWRGVPVGQCALVAVLREALARDAAPQGGRARQDARRKAQTALQTSIAFWNTTWSTRPCAGGARHRLRRSPARLGCGPGRARHAASRQPLSMSEPGHALEIMAGTGIGRSSSR